MLTTYRIFKTKHASVWFDGEGSFQFGGRWNSHGWRLLYTSISLSLAALEILVNLNSEGLLSSYSFAKVQFSDDLVLPLESFRRLPLNWSDSPAPLAVQRIGDDWADKGISAVLRVPSAVLPMESNFLVNIEHPEFSKIKLGVPDSFVFDKRLYNFE